MRQRWIQSWCHCWVISSLAIWIRVRSPMPTTSPSAAEAGRGTCITSTSGSGRWKRREGCRRRKLQWTDSPLLRPPNGAALLSRLSDVAYFRVIQAAMVCLSLRTRLTKMRSGHSPYSWKGGEEWSPRALTSRLARTGSFMARQSGAQSTIQTLDMDCSRGGFSESLRRTRTTC